MAKAEGSKEVERKLKLEGFAFQRQNGSHMVFRHPDGRTAIVPAGRKALPTGTLRSIYKQANLPWPPK
jgi:predicted RNA binding protein YcfA (HicA-like mRNA interferase family)